MQPCYYVLCWNASEFPLALVARLPRFVPVPVEAPSSMALFRERRDFGISAVIVGIIAATAVTASVTASALTLSGTVRSAATINKLSSTVTTAMEAGHLAYTQIQGRLLLVNQRIDLVQEQLDVLWQVAQLGYERRLPGLCVTSVQYDNFTRAANLSKVLSQHLLQNWTVEFDQTLRELRTAILQINSTRLDLSLTKGLASWISSAFSYFKEWVGVGMFGAFFCLGLGFMLWLICKIYSKNKREKIMITQALMALEHGRSAEVWLAALKRQWMLAAGRRPGSSCTLSISMRRTRMSARFEQPMRVVELSIAQRDTPALSGKHAVLKRVACPSVPSSRKTTERSVRSMSGPT